MSSSDRATESPTTAAFHLQAVLSFGIALAAVVVGVIYMPADPWVRAFLAVSVLYVTTSAFTLAKTVRDKQERTTVLSRVDQARLEKLLAEHDPFRPAA
ncbi:YiaA/YiaB family inner membrane protein [Pseudonocardia ailaonensis]|uniref:YiaA/YiaB family inner membrane protein n=1 Tax=Pseudonocardia ailaonensis TaxID=367279 RepID=A0ABN2MMW9_9PSEU